MAPCGSVSAVLVPACRPALGAKSVGCRPPAHCPLSKQHPLPNPLNLPASQYCPHHTCSHDPDTLSGFLLIPHPSPRWHSCPSPWAAPRSNQRRFPGTILHPPECGVLLAPLSSSSTHSVPPAMRSVALCIIVTVTFLHGADHGV